MKKLALVAYTVGVLLIGALLGGGIAYSYFDQFITVGTTKYSVILNEDRGQISVYPPKKAINLRDQGPHLIVFDVVNE